MAGSRQRDRGPRAGQRAWRVTRLLATLAAMAGVLQPIADAGVAGATYPNGEPARWEHASVIADQTLYVFGGRSGDGNTKDDFAVPCMALDLSAKLSASSAVWSHVCSKNGPQLAGHTATINPTINMVMLFGGNAPSGSLHASNPLRLFSAEIRFWNTPTNSGFPQPLVNHSASLDTTTGDLVVYGGQTRDGGLLSNSTLRMVTDPDAHELLQPPPEKPFVIIVSPSTTSASASATRPTSSASASESKSTPASASRSSSDASSSTSKTRSSPSSSSSSSSSPSSSTASTSSPSSSPRPTSLLSSLLDDGAGGQDGGILGLARRSGDSSSSSDTKPLMTWANDTLPYGVSGRVGHTLTAVNGTLMVVLGGDSDGALISMKTLFVYDAPRQAWTQRTAGGRIPAARRNHVATVVNGTKIIVHGGANAAAEALGDVAVLDIATWTWTQPKITGAPAARYAHAAVQAGPYMVLTFGRADVGAGDYGVYFLDTTSWAFVDQYDPGRARLGVLMKSQHVTGGTIFGLLVASAVALLVLLIMLYIACMHYYNRHPRLDDGETDTMLPTTELRSFGRRITVRLTARRQRRAKDSAPARNVRPAPEPTPVPVSRPEPIANADVDDSSSMQLMFNISRDSSLDLDFMGYGRPEKPSASDTTRLSRRTHLDDVELPAGLRNRESSVDAAPDPSSWSRPTTSHSNVRQKSAHISDVLPRIVGSRLTLPPEPAAATARYRFDELEDSPSYDSAESLPLPPPIPAAVGHDPPPVSSSSPTLRPSAASDQDSALNRPIAPFAQSTSSLRDSIDINTVMSQNQRFYLVNPDD